MGVVYLARNKVNGKCYVGKTECSFEGRQKRHLESVKYGSSCAFHCAIRLYGSEAFEWSVLFENNRNDILCGLEKLYIKRFQCKAPNGYNLTDGGDGQCGFHHTKEALAKMSATQKKIGNRPPSRKGLGHTAEARRKISEGHIGIMHTDEAKAKISVALTGRPLSKEHREKLSASHMGQRRPHSSETKAKIGNGNRGKIRSPELRARISMSLLGNLNAIGGKKRGD